MSLEEYSSRMAAWIQSLLQHKPLKKSNLDMRKTLLLEDHKTEGQTIDRWVGDDILSSVGDWDDRN